MKVIVLTTLLALAAGPASAASNLKIENPWARATPKGASVGAGYLTIENDGAAADRLTGGVADIGMVQVHEMNVTDGVMRMREVEGGLEIAARATVKLAPGSYHLMFTPLKRPLVKGETVKATLTFAHAGSIAVEFPVLGVGAAAAPAGMGGMKM